MESPDIENAPTLPAIIMIKTTCIVVASERSVISRSLPYRDSRQSFSLAIRNDLTNSCGVSPETHATKRRGVSLVLACTLITALVVVMAFVLDWGHISIARNELQRSADAAALAACWQLFDDKVSERSLSETEQSTHRASSDVAAANRIANQSPTLSSALADLQLGTYSFSTGSLSAATGVADINAVRVSVRRQQEVNGEVPLFFAKVLGKEGQAMQATAVAAMSSRIGGFRIPGSDGECLDVLPFALDLETWLDVLAKRTVDEFTSAGDSVLSGPDGYHECNLFPQGTGSPGNRGTVDIGSSNNSTADLCRQILHGISQQDLIDFGRPFRFDHKGVILLNGDTGISAAVKAELEAIIGQKRIIPIFESVVKQGNTAWYKIVRLEGVRILEVDLTGAMNQKRLIIQPVRMLARHAVIDDAGALESETLHTPVMLVQ